jgi:hypothetical protein
VSTEKAVALGAVAPAKPVDWNKVCTWSLYAGIGGFVLALIGFVPSSERFFYSYLTAYLFWLALPLGSMAILMLQYVTGGRWGVVLRGGLEAAIATLPLLVLLFVPLLAAMAQPLFLANVGYPYIWMDTKAVQSYPDLAKKTWYLNPAFFLVRTAFYFAAWLVLGWLLRRGAPRSEGGFDRERELRLQALAGPGIFLYALTITFAAIDWIMSLDPLWASTIFGVLLAVSQLLPALALAILMLALAAPESPVAETMTSTLWKDLGNLLLAFVLIWSYMSFSQFFLIWNGNLPEETRWYWFRSVNDWQVLGVSLILVYFGVPFGMLLLSDWKTHSQRLCWVTGGLLIMHYLYTYWLIIPEYARRPWGGSATSVGRELSTTVPLGASLHWLDPVTFVGIGGLWLAYFLWNWRSRPLLPRQHPALLQENHHG